MKKLLFVLIACVLCLGMVGGAFAYFSDTETSTGNTFTAGTLDLKVDGEDDGATVVHITVDNMKPGDDTGYFKWVLRNDGSISGYVSATFSAMTNNDNGLTEPESAVDATGGAGQGELGQYLRPGVEPEVAIAHGATIVERNDEQGWYIASVDSEIDTEGTIGWGPAGWSVPSQLYSVWQAGPPHPWGIPGLNNLASNTYGYGGSLHYNGDILNPGEEVAFFFRVNLRGPEPPTNPIDNGNLMLWDGTKWVEVDDNIVQGDSVSFDITFKLEQ